ncbi:hypothetical protein ABT034_29070 [Streptomyces sp. NPDC002773]|uniref:hypothetical protein n=1 Tax=Streptomyces sp. NPDC002773 TaxID=3154430 RepID=UPI003333CFDA
MTSSLVTPLRNRRVGAAVAAALCALALTACGTETAGGGAPAGAGARSGAAQVAAPPPAATPTPTPTPTAPVGDPADDPRLTPEQQAAEFRLLELAVDLAEPCAGDPPPLPVEIPTTEPDGPPPLPAEVPTTEPEGPPPAKGEKSPSGPPLAEEEPPSAKPWDFERARQETELSAVDTCVAPLHGKRIAKALDGKADPSPASVEKVLHSLGYDIDYRLHGPQEVNGKVEFTLDLRFMGGELCLTGRYDGTRTSFDPYGASMEVRCPDVKRRA